MHIEIRYEGVTIANLVPAAHSGSDPNVAAENNGDKYDYDVNFFAALRTPGGEFP